MFSSYPTHLPNDSSNLNLISSEEIYRVHLNTPKHSLHLVVSIIYVNSFGAICLSDPNGPMARYEEQKEVMTYQPCLTSRFNSVVFFNTHALVRFL